MNKEKFKRIKKIKDLDDYYERKIDEPQLQKLIKIEKKIDQIESNKAKQTTKEIKLDTQQTIKKIGKRGYKFCKNPACEAQIFINCHKCPHCQFQAKENIQKIIDKNTNQNVIQQRIDKIAKKLDLNKPIYDNTHVYTWKKYLLFKNEFNKRTFYDEQITNNISKLFDIKQEQISDDMQEQNKYIHGDQKRSTYKKINQLDHSSQKEVQVQFNDGDKISIQQYQDHSFPEGSQWNEYFFNLGFPITCLKWAPRKNDDVDQYLACSFNAHNFKDHYKNEMDFITINAYNLEYFIKQGKKYKDAKGFIFIYKIQYDLEEKKYKNPILCLKLECDNGSILDILWCPSRNYSKNSIGILACLKSIGNIQFFDINNKHSQQLQQIDPFITLKVSDEILISCFDWIINQEYEQIIVGDQIGNIYLFEYDSNIQEFILLQIYHQAHTQEANISKIFIIIQLASTYIISCIFQNYFDDFLDY